MRQFFNPTESPTWMEKVLSSIRNALGDIWPAPLRLKDYTTANRPTAASFSAGLIYDSTDNRPAYSTGAAWVELMPYVAGAALTKVDDTNVTLTLTGAPATALLAATGLTLGWTGTLSAARGGTGTGTYAIGDILFASTTSALSRLADVATGNALISGGVGVAPSWGKISISTHVSGLATGIATFLATPSSANLLAAVTDETGSGALVFATIPTISTPTINGIATITADTSGYLNLGRFSSGFQYSLIDATSGALGGVINHAGATVIRWSTTAGVECFYPAIIPSYTVATVPSVVNFTRGLIYVSNESGGAVPAFSDGVNWRRVTDRAIIS